MATQQHQNRMQDQPSGLDDPMALASHYCGVTEDLIRNNPMLVTVAVFGLGVGLGTLLSSQLAEPPTTSRRHTAEVLGRRMLDSIAEVLPDSIRRHVG
jgi:hypothetical protein